MSQKNRRACVPSPSLNVTLYRVKHIGVHKTRNTKGHIMITQRSEVKNTTSDIRRKSSWRCRGVMFLVQRLVMTLVLAPVLPIAPPSADAAVHGSCNKCGQFVVLSESGAGFRRHWQGRCGKCKESLVRLMPMNLEEITDQLGLTY